MRRYWVSWEEPVGEDGDWRPNGQWPVPEAIKAYWCSGEGDGYATICAVVDAPDERRVWSAIGAAWPSRGAVRFCEVRAADWRPEPSRFPWPEGG